MATIISMMISYVMSCQCIAIFLYDQIHARYLDSFLDTYDVIMKDDRVDEWSQSVETAVMEFKPKVGKDDGGFGEMLRHWCEEMLMEQSAKCQKMIQDQVEEKSMQSLLLRIPVMEQRQCSSSPEIPQRFIRREVFVRFRDRTRRSFPIGTLELWWVEDLTTLCLLVEESRV
jgi:hypothetical protein